MPRSVQIVQCTKPLPSMCKMCLFLDDAWQLLVTVCKSVRKPGAVYL